MKLFSQTLLRVFLVQAGRNNPEREIIPLSPEPRQRHRNWWKSLPSCTSVVFSPKSHLSSLPKPQSLLYRNVQLLDTKGNIYRNGHSGG